MNKKKLVEPEKGKCYWAFKNGKLGYGNLTAFEVISISNDKVICREKSSVRMATFTSDSNNEWWSENNEYRLDVDASMLDYLESLFD